MLHSLLIRLKIFFKLVKKVIKLFHFFVSLPGYNWNAQIKYTQTNLENIQAAEFFWFLRMLLEVKFLFVWEEDMLLLEMI